MSQAIRVVHRTLELVRMMNKQDSWTLHELNAHSQLPKATLHRLLHVLESEGYVRTPPSRPGIYRLTSAIRELSAGITASTIFADAAQPIIIEGTRQTQWPLAFALADGAYMRVVSCGMPYNPSHSAKATSEGHRHWMFTSALGKAYFAYSNAEQRKQVTDAATLTHTTPAQHKRVERLPSLCELGREISEIRQRGYATRHALHGQLNATFAVPVISSNDVVLGALACSTFPRLLTESFITTLLPTVKPISEMLAHKLESALIERC